MDKKTRLGGVLADLSGDNPNTNDLDNEFKKYEIESQSQKLDHQKKLFWSILTSSAILILAVGLVAMNQFEKEITTQEAIVLGMFVSAPIILILALLRYVYDGRKKDEPQPTLLLNVGKELGSVIMAIFKKSQ